MAPEKNNVLLKRPENTKEEIRKIYGLNKPGRMEEAVDIIENWLHKQDHILKKDFDRDYLEVTIIACKGSLEKAKKQIDRLCTMKTLMPQFFTKTNVKAELKHILNIAWLVPLPVVIEDYYRVLIMKINDRDFVEKNYLEYYQYCLILCEYMKAHDYVNGFVIVYDYRDTNLIDVMTKMNPIQLQQYMTILIEGYGARLKKLCFLTSSKTVDIFVKMIKPFLSAKIGDRIVVYKTLEDLYTAVPKDLLPIEYGGKERPLNDIIDDWTEELSTKEHVSYMKMMNKAGTDERLRRSDHFNQEYMGMPGSFRNLSVD